MACQRRLGGRRARLLLGVPSVMDPGQALAVLCPPARLSAGAAAAQHERLLWLLYMYLRAVQCVSFLQLYPILQELLLCFI